MWTAFFFYYCITVAQNLIWFFISVCPKSKTFLQYCVLVCRRFQSFFTDPAYLTSPGGERQKRGSSNCVLITKAFLCILGGVTCVCACVHSLRPYLLCITCQWCWSASLRLRLMSVAPGTAIRITLITQGPVTEAI